MVLNNFFIGLLKLTHHFLFFIFFIEDKDESFAIDVIFLYLFCLFALLLFSLFF